MSSANKAPDYVFTRDYLDNDRINLQHYQWIQLFGYYIHPDIARDSSTLRIADVGTGTAVWLTDLARTLPENVQLDGLDISFNATPPAPWLPKNVNLHTWNVKTEVPESLVGVYDIVHIRAFGFVLLDADVPPVLEKLSRLLKPGGYLQWGEPDIASFRIETTSPDVEIDASTQLFKLGAPQDPRLQPKWVANLPTLFDTAGFQNVVTDTRDPPKHLAFAMHECSLLIHELLARQTKNQQVQEALKTILPQVAEESRHGAMWAFTRWTVIGQKPSQS